MSAEDDYWSECIGDAAEACGLELTAEQRKGLVKSVQVAHEYYGMAFYSPPSSDRLDSINSEWEAKFRSLKAEFDAYKQGANPAAINELLDRIEMAEQEHCDATSQITQQLSRLADENVRLRARIDEMERQEPSHWGCNVLQSDGRWKEEVSREAPPEGYFSVRDAFPLYLAPGAQGEIK